MPTDFTDQYRERVQSWLAHHGDAATVMLVRLKPDDWSEGTAWEALCAFEGAMVIEWWEGRWRLCRPPV